MYSYIFYTPPNRTHKIPHAKSAQKSHLSTSQLIDYQPLTNNAQKIKSAQFCKTQLPHTPPFTTRHLYLSCIQPLAATTYMDLKKFRLSALRKRKSHALFLDQLNDLVPPDMDDIARRADEAAWQQVSCTQCANCCKKMTPTFSPADVKRIATHLGLSTKEVKEKWLYKEEGTGDWMNRNQPCQFLDNNMCSIYEVRPADCAGFPHHHKTPWDDYNDMYKTNMMHCPATLAMVSAVRQEVLRRYEWPKAE